MLPFFPSLPNQLRSQAPTNDPSLQQAAMLSQTQIPIPPTVNLGIRNPNLGVFNVGNAAPLPPMAPPSFLNCPNVPPMMQTRQLGIFPQQNPQFGTPAQNLNQQLLALQFLGQACGMPQNLQQFHGRLQGLNTLSTLQPGVVPFLPNNLPQNFNFIGGAPNEQSCLPNMMAHGNQIGALNSTALSCLGPNSSELHGNFPTSAVENSDTNFSNAALCTEGNNNPGSLPKQKNFHGPNYQGRMKNHYSIKHKQPGNFRSQIHCTQDGGNDVNTINPPKHFSRNPRDSQRNFSRNPQGQRHTEYKRFQKPHFQGSHNTKNNVQTFNGMGGRVQKNRREGKPHFPKFNKPNFTDNRRCIPVNYTENEIRQWIEARRKNYPTRDNIEKKSTPSQVNHENIDGAARLRRQQLKEVLAKQAELGVEVAELPPGYFSESESQAGAMEKNLGAPNTDGHFPNRHNHKRGRHGQDKFPAKQSKINHKSSASSAPIIKKREPTLLQKLLEPDIKRDTSKLLQVFRFMILNNFFENYTGDKNTLVFPKISAKGMPCENATAIEEASDSTCTNKVELDVGKSCPVEEIGNAKVSSIGDGAGSASEGEDASNSSSQDRSITSE